LIYFLCSFFFTMEEKQNAETE